MSRRLRSSTIRLSRACPRATAGSAGQWTKIGSFLAELTATQLNRLGIWAVAQLGLEAAGAVTAAGLIVVPSWGNKIRVEGDIKGLPGGRYSWNRDEAQLHLTYQTADGERRAFTAQRKGNKFPGPREQVVGVVLPDDNVTIDADALPERPANDNEPKLCPRPVLDNRTNNKGIDYEIFMRSIVNPFMPTPLGWGYKAFDLRSGKAVEFDDCEQKTGTMIDYKDRYWEILTKPRHQQLRHRRTYESGATPNQRCGSAPYPLVFRGGASRELRSPSPDKVR
jgi:hypothetical protein